MKDLSGGMRRRLRLLAAVLAMLAAGLCYSCTVRPMEAVSVRLEEEPSAELAATEGEEGVPAPEKSSDEDVSSEAEEQPKEELLCVHVCGHVRNPGVYRLPAGSRIYDAVQAAGGVTEEAAADYLNLAEAAADGMRIEVPSVSQAAQWESQGRAYGQGTASSGGASGQRIAARVNLNTATKEELMTLKGIGESRAEDIIQYRETYGGFTRIEDIMNISGIKDAAFAKIKDDITV